MKIISKLHCYEMNAELYCTESFLLSRSTSTRLCKWTLNGTQYKIRHEEAKKSCPNGSELFDYMQIPHSNFKQNVCYSCNRFDKLIINYSE